MNRQEVFEAIVTESEMQHIRDVPKRSMGYWLRDMSDTLDYMVPVAGKSYILTMMWNMLESALCCMYQHGGVKRGMSPPNERIDRPWYTEVESILLGVVAGERDYQNNLPLSRSDGKDKDVYNYAAMLESYLAKAFEAWTDNPGNWHCLDQIRKIAAIIVRCFEEHGTGD